MRFSTISAIATFAATALAQDLSTIPTCGTACVGNGLATTGCNQIDIACICGSSSWIGELACCVSQACEPADQQAIINFAQQICQPVGVTDLPTSAGCTGTNTPSSTDSASVSASVSSAASSASDAITSASGAIGSAASSISAALTSSSTAVPAGNDAAMPTPFGFAGVVAAAGLFAAAL